MIKSRVISKLDPINMAILMSKLLSLAKPYYRVGQCLAKRYVHEEKFPKTKVNLNQPSDYLIILPEPLSDTPETNELLRIPKFGEPEIDFSKFDVESLFKGFSKVICSYENFIIDFNNGYEQQSIKNIEEFFNELESYLYPMDYAYNILAALMAVKSNDYNHKELRELIDRYISARDKKHKDAFQEAFKYYGSNHFKTLPDVDKKMLLTYYPLAARNLKLKHDDEFGLGQFKKHIQTTVKTFQNNVREANRLFSHFVDDPDILAAVSSDFDDCLDLHHKERTPLKVTISSYKRFMEICPDRIVRRSLWEARNKRCSPKAIPRLKNMDNISSIRLFKRQLSNLMGYRTHLEFRIQNAIAKSRQQILDNLKRLNEENVALLDDRMQELNDFAADNSFEDPELLGIQAYDVDFWLNKYKHDIMIGKTEAELKSYFPLPVVMRGLQKFFNDYFGIEFKQNNNKFKHLWARDLQVFDVNGFNGPLGTIIYDPHRRDDKILPSPSYGHLRSRNSNLGCLPLEIISTPFKLNPATNSAHLSMDDIMNLFYSFSTVLQQLLNKYKYYELNIVGGFEPDAQNILPNLCVSYLLRDHQILQSCSERSASKSIDADLSSRILKASNYSRAFKLWHEMYIAHLDIEVHTNMEDIDKLAKNTYETYSPFSRFPDDYDYCAMEEIFAGPNDGLQYANLWSKQLAERCLQHGDIDSIRNFNVKLLDSLFDPENFDTRKKLSSLGNIKCDL